MIGIISLLVLGCAGTPKISKWTAPNDLSMDKVFNAVLIAATENSFTIVNKDRASGVISLKKQEYGGDKMVERLMSIRLKRVGDKIVVSTKVSGSNVGMIEGALGGLVHKELTNNFYVYLFRELNIDNPTLRNIVIEDAR